MARFNPKKTRAEKYFDRVDRLREQGRADLIKPLEAYRKDHHRVLDGWRENKPQTVNGKAWRGARGKQKKHHLPNS